jgi:hypothetical protein
MIRCSNKRVASARTKNQLTEICSSLVIALIDYLNLLFYMALVIAFSGVYLLSETSFSLA